MTVMEPNDTSPSASDSASLQHTQLHGRAAGALLDRYLAGGCTPEERQVVDQWLAADPDEAVHLAALRDVVATPWGEAEGHSIDALTRRFWATTALMADGDQAISGNGR